MNNMNGTSTNETGEFRFTAIQGLPVEKLSSIIVAFLVGL
jgi:hypothetical protein